jgi:hypothetical protein
MPRMTQHMATNGERADVFRIQAPLPFPFPADTNVATITVDAAPPEIADNASTGDLVSTPSRQRRSHGALRFLFIF